MSVPEAAPTAAVASAAPATRRVSRLLLISAICGFASLLLWILINFSFTPQFVFYLNWGLADPLAFAAFVLAIIGLARGSRPRLLGVLGIVLSVVDLGFFIVYWLTILSEG